MGYQAFDQYASEYDAWFLENTNVLETELRLVAACLQDSGRILSIGCGSGLFEKLLEDRYGIRIAHGIEPAEGMAAIARKRGFDVEINTAEDADYGEECYDTVLFNGCPCYMQDLGLALRKAHKALRKGGKAVVIDVPKESPYGLIYNLALAVGSWDHPLLEGCKPKDPYPIELVKQAAWRTTAEKSKALEDNGFGQSTSYGPMSPGLDFAFGFNGEDYIDKALKRGWLITDDGQTSPAMTSRANELNIELQLEPIKGLKIQLTSNRTDNRTRQVQFMFDGMPTSYAGSYTKTHMALRSALRSSGPDDG